MRITDTFKHKLESDFEQYSFPSNVNPKQRHFIDIDNGGHWKLGLVQLEESLSREEVATLMRELTDLLAFMDKLSRPDLHRHTEPGQPQHEETI